MDAGLAAAITQLIVYKYWLLLPLAIVEGPMLAFASGMLVSLGYFHPLVALGILVLGDLIPDGILFTLGRYGKHYEWAQRWGKRIGITKESFAKASAIWQKYPGKAVLTSKFAYGVSMPLLFMAGLSGIPVRTFFLYSFSISVIHYSTMMTLGYFFGASLASIGNVLTALQIGITAVIIAGIVYYLAIAHMSKAPLK